MFGRQLHNEDIEKRCILGVVVKAMEKIGWERKDK